MMRILPCFLLTCVAIAVQANSFKPNGFLSKMMAKLSGEPTLSRVIPYRHAEVDQYIDYNDLALGLFKQKLVVYDEFYKPGGPIFFLISARDDFYAYWLENSIPTEIVKQKGGAIYALEPRYHGDSRPTLSTSTSNLQSYFTLGHLIMDYVVLINSFKLHFDETYGPTKVILYGYDTGATLAAWIYSLYPDMVNGVWASSAPIYPSTELSTYFSDVQATIRNVNPKCHDSLEMAFAQIKSLFTAQEGSQISNYFNIGNPLSTLDINDIYLFYYALLSGIGSVVEYGNVDVVTDFCAVFESVVPENSLEALGNYFKEFFDGDILTYANLVNHLRPDTWDSADVINGERQQLFQSCSYLSWFRTSTDSSSFFNVNLPLEFYTKLCEDVFSIQPDDVTTGNQLTAATYVLRADLTNIYFTNGAFDPYRQVGVIGGMEDTHGSVDLIMTVDIKMVIIVEEDSIPIDNLTNYIEHYWHEAIDLNSTLLQGLIPFICIENGTILLDNLTNYIANVQKTFESEITSYKYDVIPEVGKAYDFRPINFKSHPTQLIDIKTNIITLIESWLST